MSGPWSSTGEKQECGGFALIAVLLTLLALLVLSAPFLLAARNSSRSSAELADRVQARVALDAAARHARAQLSASHPSVDTTPYFDAPDELRVRGDLDPEFWNVRDPSGVMWDLQVDDAAGRIDPSSASPHVFANLLGASTRLLRPVPKGEAELAVSSTSGFEPEGFLWVGGELVRYAGRGNDVFSRLIRGLLYDETRDVQGSECGPSPALDHPAGAPVLDQRAFAPVLWRLRGSGASFRGVTHAAELAQAAEQCALSGGWSAAALESVERATSPWSAVGAGPVWQRPARLLNAVQGGVDCRLELDETRWFNPGTTVRIRDGATEECGIVLSIEDRAIRLMDPPANDYAALSAEVSPLARRPVNVNTAPPQVLQALFQNLQWRGENSRITDREARDLAEIAVECRPITGEEDFLRRVVLPAAGIQPYPNDAGDAPSALHGGTAVIDRQDALALFANAQNANDAGLEYSTMPLCYTSRDAYELELRTSVNAESGVLRVAALRDVVEVVVPQRDLLRVWARQQDFEDELRLSRAAPWWSTGPNATSRFDGGAVPPSRLWAEIGTADGLAYLPGVTPEPPGSSPESPPTAEHVFPSREEAGWAQLWPARVSEQGSLAGRVMHFDHETRDPEGRYLPDEVIERDTRDPIVGWTPPNGVFLGAFDLSFWIKPRALDDGLFLDVGATSLESDRVTLGIEGPDLVLRVYDAVGDHPSTLSLELGEARFAIAPGASSSGAAGGAGSGGAGLAQDTWSHVAIDVRGNRPSQMTLLVDGQAFGVRYPGLSSLTAAAPDGAAALVLESAEGFPDAGVVRIGDELVEFQRTGNTLQALYQPAGRFAGFGGRVAREAIEYRSGAAPPLNTGLSKDTDHQLSAPVELYGYSTPLASNVPGGSGALAAPLGRFAVAIVDAGASSGVPAEPIVLRDGGLPLGTGIEGVGSAITEIALKPADAAMTPEELMAAFHPGGGYAALLQKQPIVEFQDPTTGSWRRAAPVTQRGTFLAEFEIIRYSGFTGTVLHVAGRGDGHGFQNPAAPPPERRAFVVDWNASWSIYGTPVDGNSYLETKVFVVPISLEVPGSSGLAAFLPAGAGVSEFAQITHIDQAELTEWVRYDEISANGHLVRNSAEALRMALYAAGLQGGLISFAASGNPSPSAGGLPGPSVNGVSGAAPPSPQSGSSGGSSAYWLGLLGANEHATEPVTQAVCERFQFRGVFGTYCHAHPGGTAVLPAWRTGGTGITTGRPGRLDAAFLVDANVADPGWPVTVHYAHVPRNYKSATWSADPANFLLAVPGEHVALAYSREVDLGATYVALQAAAPVPIAAGADAPCSTAAVAADSRCIARLVKFPSGERPRVADRVILGGSIGGGLVPSATIDEVVFGSTVFGTGSQAGDAVQGAMMVLLRELPVGSSDILVQPNEVRIALGHYIDPAFQKDYLDDLPVDAGLLRIGEEIAAYDEVDADTGVITLADSGRGLFGTEVQHHEAGETVAFLERHELSLLDAAIGPADAGLPLEDTLDFPSEGAVLVGSELIHYTRIARNSLEMPRTSTVPGAMNGRGDGIFRGRFGTPAQAHSAGEPVHFFPFRYWDRWSDRADGPELSYFGFSVDQPAGFWRTVFWTTEESGTGRATLSTLQRTDAGVPWDSDPRSTPGLALFEEGMPGGRANRVNAQCNRIEWRVFVRYALDAFDAGSGSSHGWKETPRLALFGAEHIAPYVTLRRTDR